MFSVVVPLYNKQDFVRRTIDSVLAQSLGDFEVIVVDDGSTDDSVARLEAYSDPRLRIVRQANSGEGAARNRGLHESRYEWIALLDADDYWFPDHLAALAEMIVLYPRAGLAATSYMEGEDPYAVQPQICGVEIEEIDYFRVAARQIGVVWSSAVALRRDIVRQVGDFGPWRTGADLEYWARMALKAPVIKSNRITAYYLRNEQSVMFQEQNKPIDGEPKTVFELWPSVGFLEGVRHAPEHNRRRKAIEGYQRNAAYLSMIGFLARGEIARARRIARSVPGHRIDRAAVVAVALGLPNFLLRALLAVRKRRRLGHMQPR